MLTITETALKKIAESKKKLALPVKGLRVKANPRSALRASYAFRFEPAEAPDAPTDIVLPFEGIDLYVSADSQPYLEGATIDYVFSLVSSQFKVNVPLRKLDTPDGRIAEKIQSVLDSEVNPSLADHGGAAMLIDYQDGIALLELTGGCQGCSQASATMKNSIETSLRAAVPEICEVRDVTQHARGRQPYFQ